LSAIVVNKIPHEKGVLFIFEKWGKKVKILFLNHAIDRMKRWQLTAGEVGDTLLEPEEVLKGHYNRFIAHKCYGEHVLRAVYEYDELIPTLVTVYFPYKKRYFKGGGQFENQILK